MNTGDRVKMDAFHFLYGRFTVHGLVKGRSVVLDAPVSGRRSLPLSRHLWIAENAETAGERADRITREREYEQKERYAEERAKALAASAATGRQITRGHAELSAYPIGTRLICHGTGMIWRLTVVDERGQCYGRAGDDDRDGYFGNDTHLLEFSVEEVRS